MKEEDGKERKDNPWPSSPNKPYQETEEMKLWGVFLFGLIGATVTTFALSRSQSLKGGSGKSFRTSFQEEAWKKYNRQMQEEYEEEMERVERVRRMQNVFNRERNKYKRGYEGWKEKDSSSYHQHFQQDDWYWKSDTSFRDRRANYREAPRENVSYSLSHHDSVLGLDRFRTKPYTEAEIKATHRRSLGDASPEIGNVSPPIRQCITWYNSQHANYYIFSSFGDLSLHRK
ncbi:uncharacterized protein LOC133803286 isoform X3 [Humulus lupulus]|uniref:uncharacterized protein LOC133803286 isoform X3 n=1 Tax=Humulus lupulus TaxID=3486 RepID=UPI002B4118A1|nr:uncharacterized protein LOC133803286 isoform X3 [Humulus lupulus]